MKRLLVWMAVAMASGIMFADLLADSSIMLGLVCLACFLAFILLYKRKGQSVRFLVCIPFLLVGFLLHSWNLSLFHEKVLSWNNQSITVIGYLSSEPESDLEKTVIVLETESILQMKIHSKLRLVFYNPDMSKKLVYGQKIEVQGVLLLPSGKRNPGGFDYSKYLNARGITAQLTASSEPVDLGQTRTFFLKKAGFSIRSQIIGSLHRFLPVKEADVLSGMLIGYTADINDDLTVDFRKAGLSHIMAVSGANIAFLLLPLLWFFTKLRWNIRKSSFIGFIVMMFFVFATGMEASVVRAAVMAGVMLIGRMMWRQTDIFCSLAVSMVLICLENTFWLYDAGFQLSFLATLSLAMFYKPVFGVFPEKIPKIIREALAGTLSAQIGVFPVLLYHFNTLTTFSVPANLLTVPMTGVVTLTGTLTVIFGSIFAPLGWGFGWVSARLVDWILWVTQTVASLPFSEIHVVTPSVLGVSAWFVIIFWLRYSPYVLEKHQRRRLTPVVGLACLVMVLIQFVPSKDLQITFIDVGQGDSICIRTPRGRSILVDSGGNPRDNGPSYAGEKIVVPFLLDEGITKPDVVVSTHSHADHFSGIHSVVELLGTKEFIYPDINDSAYDGILQYFDIADIPTRKASAGDVIYREQDFQMTVLSPDRDFMKTTTDLNEKSMVLRIVYKDFSILLTSDIGPLAESSMLSTLQILKAVVLKVPHHGAKNGLSQEFLDEVSPKQVVISVGRNSYGHPAADILEMLKENDIGVDTTINGGAIVYKTDGFSLQKSTTIKPRKYLFNFNVN